MSFAANAVDKSSSDLNMEAENFRTEPDVRRLEETDIAESPAGYGMDLRRLRYSSWRHGESCASTNCFMMSIILDCEIIER